MQELDTQKKQKYFHTVRGVFVEGQPVYPNAGISTKTKQKILEGQIVIMKLKLALWGAFLLALGSMTAWRGIKDLVVSVRETQPTQMTCAEYHQKRPNMRWLHLTDCRVDYRKAQLFDYNGTPQTKRPSEMISPIFVVAIRPKDPHYRGFVQLLMRVEAQSIRHLLHLLFEYKAAGKTNDLQQLLRDKQTQIVALQEVRGFVSFSDGTNGRLHSKMRDHYPDNLAARYGLLQEGRNPPESAGWILVAFGSACLLAGIGLLLRSLRVKEDDTAQEVITNILNS